ncbi:MAG TPA: ABC transporter permease [Thermoanaerobaculia bacterium]|jgi:putative ABC transport system permease protein|nr:ABC transporter permease [Thermoanaerobaculia bacterium]
MLRRLLRQPATVFPAIALVALAVGVSTGLFAYLGAVLWPRVDGPRGARMVAVYLGTDQDPRLPSSYRDFELLHGRQERRAGLRELAAYTPIGVAVGGSEPPRFAWAFAVSGDYFATFGARPLLGRLLQPADDRPGAPAVVVLHPAFWRAQLGGDRDVIGKPLPINGRQATIVGIAPEGFIGHGRGGALYVPLQRVDEVTGTARLTDPMSHFLQLVGRVDGDVTLPRLQAALAPAARAADAEGPIDGGDPTTGPSSGARRVFVARADRYDSVGPDPQLDAARALLGGALLFLLLAAASVTNLQLARTAARQRDRDVRAALGEPRANAVGRLIAEVCTVCSLGALASIPIALALAARLDAWAVSDPGGLGSWWESTRLVRIDLRSLGFALAGAAACAVLASLASLPAVLRPLRTLAAARGTAGDSRGGGVRRALVVLQLALSLVLCIGGGTLARTLRNAAQRDPGFPVNDLHIATLYAPRNLGGANDAGQLYARIREEMLRLPGTEAASLSQMPPLAGWFRTTMVSRPERPEQAHQGGYDLVFPGYFSTLGVPLRAGRALDERDRADGQPAVVIAETLARQLFGDAAQAVGREIDVSGAPSEPWNVVGVAADVNGGPAGSPTPPAVYFPYAQRGHSRMSLLLHSRLPPETVAAQVRGAVARVAPLVASVDFSTGEQALDRLLTAERMHAELASLFAALGLAVAAIGLFGLLSHAVTSGRRELAVRMAVGAERRDVLLLVLGTATRLLLIGAGLGLALWVPAARLIRGLLYGVQPLDPASMLIAPALLALAALAAALLPALRAARTEPARALRQD